MPAQHRVIVAAFDQEITERDLLDADALAQTVHSALEASELHAWLSALHVALHACRLPVCELV
jgi:hypothetical protein